MYDHVHTGTRCGKTRALGCRQRHYVPGDPVHLVPVLPSRYPDASSGVGDAPELVSFQVAMTEGGFIVARNQALVGWVDAAEPDLPAVSDTGDLLGPGGGEPADADAVRAHELEQQLGVRNPTEAFFTELAQQTHATTTGASISGARLATARELAELLGLPFGCPVCAFLRTGS